MFLEAVNSLGVTLILVTHDRNIVRSRRLRELHITVLPRPDGASRAVLEA
jgi:ABC-type ATPase involved in cell division